ncbi:hypothetical protein HK096_009262, partial [Nowakowskiella sp. JEL0078]
MGIKLTTIKRSLSKNNKQFKNEALEISLAAQKSVKSTVAATDTTEINKPDESIIRAESLGLKLNKDAAQNWRPQKNDDNLENERSFHQVDESPYPLPKDTKEVDRLDTQHITITESFGRLFQMPI